MPMLFYAISHYARKKVKGNSISDKIVIKLVGCQKKTCLLKLLASLNPTIIKDTVLTIFNL